MNPGQTGLWTGQTNLGQSNPKYNLDQEKCCLSFCVPMDITGTRTSDTAYNLLHIEDTEKLYLIIKKDD